MKIVRFSGGASVVVDEFQAGTFSLELRLYDQALRVVAVTDVEIADVAIALANLPGVREIIAGAVALDKVNRPEKYRR